MHTSARITSGLVQLLLILIYTGCALSPQTVSIRPELSGVNPGTGQGKRLAVNVKDSRNSNLVGFRGGVYETATIVTADNMTASIYEALSQAYTDSGFTIVEDAGDADLSVNVYIEKMESKTVKRKLIWNIEMNAAFKATVLHETTEKSIKLEDHYTREYGMPPSEKDNERLINNIISKLLQRLVDNNSLYQQ